MDESYRCAGMPNAMQVHVLKEFQPYLRILNAFNVENYQGSDRARIVANIFYVALVGLFTISTFMILSLAYWNFIDTHFRMGILSTTLPILMTILQIVFTQLSLTVRSRLITATIAHFRKVIDGSKFFH